MENNETKNLELKKLKTFFDNHEVSIPTYQRVYTWGEEQISYYFSDLLDDLEKERNTNIGVMYYEAEDSDSVTYQIIDGQQRLTTSMLVICYLALKDRSLNTAVEFTRNILENKKFKSEIEELKVIYTEFFSFIKMALDDKSLNMAKLKANYNSNNKVRSVSVENNDLLSAIYKIDSIFKKLKDGYHISDFDHNRIVDKILNTEFYLIKNPYKNDPVSIFERLNNRGKALSFISLSKIKVYEYFEKEIKLEKFGNSKSIALNYMESYGELIHSIFLHSHGNQKMETKDKILKDTLIDFLSQHNSENIPNDRSKQLASFEKFLSGVKLKKENYNQVNSQLNGHFRQYLIFASINMLQPKKSVVKFKPKDRSENIFYLNKKETSNQYYVLRKKPSDAEFEAIRHICELEIPNLPKFKMFSFYVMSDILIHESYLPTDKKEKEKTLKEFVNSILRWTATSYITHVGKEINVTFREEMDLREITLKYHSLDKTNSRINEITSFINQKTEAKRSIDDIEKIEEFEKLYNDSNETDPSWEKIKWLWETYKS